MIVPPLGSPLVLSFFLLVSDCLRFATSSLSIPPRISSFSRGLPSSTLLVPHCELVLRSLTRFPTFDPPQLSHFLFSKRYLLGGSLFFSGRRCNDLLRGISTWSWARFILAFTQKKNYFYSISPMRFLLRRSLRAGFFSILSSNFFLSYLVCFSRTSCILPNCRLPVFSLTF